jgi:hypothetical protein
MKDDRITRVMECLGALIPGPSELTLLLPVLFGLYTAARAIGFEAKSLTEAGVAVAVTFGWLVWVAFNFSVCGTGGSTATGNMALQSRDSSKSVQGAEPREPCQTLDCPVESRPKEALDSLRSVQRPSEAARQAKRYPAGLP